jgi:DNA-binding transcriptional LysR family regulator
VRPAREGFTFEQLKVFIACVERGSFSAAARRLGRAQSVVSESIAQLEQQLGVKLFDRSGRLPQLTDEGRVLLADARVLARGMESLKSRAKSLGDGMEPELSVAIDALYPIEWLTEAVDAFRREFPSTPLRLQMDVLGAVLQPLMDAQCQLVVIGPQPELPEGLMSAPLMNLPAVTVVAPTHPLAAHRGPIPRALAEQHVQLVSTDRSGLTSGRDYDVLSPLTWRLAGLGLKQAFLRAGFGWGRMPRPQVDDDLAQGLLQAIQVEGMSFDTPYYPLRVVYRRDAPPGRVARWFLQQLMRADPRDVATVAPTARAA